MKKIFVTLFAMALLGIIANPLWASDNKVYKLRLASVSGPSHLHNVVMKEWAEEVKKETNGRLVIVVLDGAQLGGEREYIEGMRLGTIDMAQVSTGPISSFVPQFMVCALPYVFQSYDQIASTLEGPLGQKLFELLKKENIVGLTWFTNGYRSVFNSKRPINTPADLKGLKIRVMESPLMVGTLNAMGASATPMAYGELYTALQQGVMDGAENAPGNVLNDKFYEVAKYFSVTEHFAPPGVVAISNAAFSKLPEDLQIYLKKSAKELGIKERAADAKAQAKYLEDLKAKGVHINTVDKAAFTKAVKPVIDQFSAEIGPEVMNLLK